MAYKKRMKSAFGLVSITALVSAGTSISAPAHAQAFSSVVDVCSGVSLPRSEVTDLLGAVLPPIVTPIQGTVNNVLGVVSVIPIVGTLFPDLNIDVTTILNNASSGAPLSLQVVDNNGTILGAADDCNNTADGYTLNTEGGISIGGNAITGLGANGQAASAAELDAIAFGNNASTLAGATGAIALGSNALASAANSVALGAGSVADRGAQVAYTAPGLTGTFDSVGSVSVGSAGNLRQITNVAPGSAATDAATVGQVEGVLAAVTALDALAIQYDDATQAAVTFGGAGGTTLSNVADGTLSAGSTEAVNGSQLFATNQAVTANTAAIATNTGNIATNTANIATNTSDIAALQSTAVQYDDASQASITLGGAGGTTITNVADGALNAGSTDAVNGSQLFATNQAVAANTADIAVLQGDVATNTADIATLQTGLAGVTADVTTLQANVATNTADIAALQGSAIQYDDATHTSLTLDGAGGTTITNVADGALSAGSSDAVNGSQLFATNETVAANTADITNLDGRVTVNEGDITDLKSRATSSETNIATLQTDVSNVEARVTVNEGAITVLQTQIANVPVHYVEDAAPGTRSAVPTDTIALAGASGGTAKLTNVAAGALSASSTDAVNGSQLYATNQRVDQNTTDIQTITNNLSGSTVVAVQYSNPDNPTVSNGGTVTNDVTLVGADSTAPVVLHNVANGTRANDAVNMGQFQAGLNDVLADSMAYTDRQLSTLAFNLENLSHDMRRMREDAFAGTASAMAVAGIPQTMEAGGRMVGGAIGYYRGETAFALGASSTFNDGRGVAKVGATLDGRGHGGFSAGAGFSF